MSQLQHPFEGWGHLLHWVQAPHIIITVVSNPNQLIQKKIRFQHHTNLNPQPLIIRTQGHNNNKKFGKMNLYEAFQQAVSVTEKKEQNWYLTIAEMLPTLRWKEVAAKRWLMMKRERERELQKWRLTIFFYFLNFSFYLHQTRPISKSKFEFQQRVNTVGLTEVKVCIVFQWRGR